MTLVATIGTNGVFGGEGNDILVWGSATMLVGNDTILAGTGNDFCLAASGTIGFTVGVGRTV